MDQPGKVDNPVRGQLIRENDYFPVPVRAQEFGLVRQVRPSRAASACSFSTLGLKWCLLTGFLPISSAAYIYFYRHPPSDQSRVNPVMQLRTDGGSLPRACRHRVSSQGSSSSGRGLCITMDQLMCASLSHTHSWYEVGIMLYVCIYTCIILCMAITCSRVRINRVRLTILLVVSWTRKMTITLSPVAPDNLVSRDEFSRPVPGQPAHSLYSGYVWCLLTEFLLVSAAASIYLYRLPPSSQSRVNPVTQMRTDVVHCRQFAGAGPVVLNVVPVTDAAFADKVYP